MIRDILKHPDPRLYQISDEVREDELEIVEHLIQDLLDTCELSNGLGLAAPQIGNNIRVIVIKRNNGEMLGIVNPKIVSRSGIKVKSEEQCLSVPERTVIKRRNYSVRVVGSNDVDVELKDRESCVVQHECDHLNGVTIMSADEVDNA